MKQAAHAVSMGFSLLAFHLLDVPFCRYDRTRCEVKYVKDMQLLGAMAPPGGGRNMFSQRISACFSMVNMTQPNDVQLRRIFGTLLNCKLADFDDEVRVLGEPVVAASVDIYRVVCRELLPTPSKSHYLFNTRDISKIIQGVLQVCLHDECRNSHAISQVSFADTAP